MKKVYYITLILSCLFMTGCNKEDMDDGYGERVAVQFGGGNIAQTKTSAGGDQWTTGDPIGIYMVNHGQQLSPGTVVGNADNIQYKASMGNTRQCMFLPDNETIYYPVDGRDVDFIAYYPYNQQITGYTYPLDVTNQNDPASINVVYSNNVVEKNKRSGTVDLEFRHLLCKLTFEISRESSMTNFNKLFISNVYAKANIDLRNGQVSALNLPSEDVELKEIVQLEYSAILIPQSLTNSELTVADDVNNLYNWTFPQMELEAGKHYRFVVAVGNRIEVRPGNITNWTGINDPPQIGNPIQK